VNLSRRDALRTVALLSLLTIAASSTGNVQPAKPLTSGKPQDGGTARGEVTQAGSVTKLSHAYAIAVAGPDGQMLRLVLADHAIPLDTLVYPRKLTNAASGGVFFAVIVDFDATRKPTRSTFFVKGLPADLSVAEVTKFTPRPSVDGSLAGRVTFEDPDFSFRYSVDFDAPIVRPPADREVEIPAGASVRETVKIDLRNQGHEFDQQGFFRAVMDNDAKVVKLYLVAGMPPDASPRRDTPLKDAVDRGSTEVAKLLINGGADVNWEDEYDQTLVMNAASMGRLAILDALIAAGADVNRPNTYKIAPLAAAAEQGQFEVVKRLIAAKADVNAQNDYGGSALTVAVLRGYTDIVKVLIAAGADVKRDKEQLLELARGQNHTHLIPILETAARRP
jgi:hypothetical protein